MEGLQGKFQEKFIAQALKKANLTLSIAESCTGGLACHKITNIPGSSEYFIMGIVSYSNKSKIDFLDVPENIIKMHLLALRKCKYVFYYTHFLELKKPATPNEICQIWKPAPIYLIPQSFQSMYSSFDYS